MLKSISIPMTCSMTLQLSLFLSCARFIMTPPILCPRCTLPQPLQLKSAWIVFRSVTSKNLAAQHSSPVTSCSICGQHLFDHIMSNSLQRPSGVRCICLVTAACSPLFSKAQHWIGSRQRTSGTRPYGRVKANLHAARVYGDLHHATVGGFMRLGHFLSELISMTFPLPFLANITM